jgi:3',5'-cyclic AMP phosphodiesterase CpdA
MPRFRLAHFSDVHYTLGPLVNPRESFRGKRIASFVSYVVGGRRERFARGPERIAALLEDVDRVGVDHALCTGDLTAASLDEEFAGIASLFGDRRARPDRFTVLPGNHDRYVPSAVIERHFERHFGSLCPGAEGGFPFEKTLASGVRVVAIDAARPTTFADASGLCGPAQRAAFRELLAKDTESVTLVAMHYGLLRYTGEPDRFLHRMRDWEPVLADLDASKARVALVLHGHMHGAFTASSKRTTMICAGSATDLLVDCGYFIYEIDTDSLEVSIERRHWNRRDHRFETVDVSDFEAAVRARRGARLPHQAIVT